MFYEQTTALSDVLPAPDETLVVAWTSASIDAKITIILHYKEKVAGGCWSSTIPEEALIILRAATLVGAQVAVALHSGKVRPDGSGSLATPLPLTTGVVDAEIAIALLHSIVLTILGYELVVQQQALIRRHVLCAEGTAAPRQHREVMISAGLDHL